MVLTKEILLKFGAAVNCLEMEKFDELFPDGAQVTVENLDLAKKAGLNPVRLACLIVGRAGTEILPKLSHTCNHYIDCAACEDALLENLREVLSVDT